MFKTLSQVQPHQHHQSDENRQGNGEQKVGEENGQTLIKEEMRDERDAEELKRREVEGEAAKDLQAMRGKLRSMERETLAMHEKE